MAANTKVGLLEQLRASGLLQPAQLQELARLPEARDADPLPLARKVVQRGWLSRYQVTLIHHGRAKELTLGPYQLLERLGAGGMGEVFKAKHQRLGRVVALKTIRKEKLSHPLAVQRFYQEAHAAGQLHHPNIVLAYDAGEADGTHFLSMELVEGRDLARLVAKAGPLPVPQACDYVRQAALGLQHAHEHGLVHRDIKPHNLLVSMVPPPESLAGGKGPAWGTVKVLDLGLARVTQVMSEQERHLTRDGAVLGTPDFLAPEQALDSRSVDGRSDIYSLGCTLYFLLTARTPFHAESLTRLLLKHQMEDAVPLESLRPDVPAGVLDIVRRMLVKKPEDRFQTMAEVAAALEPFCNPDGVAAQVLPTQPGEPEDENTWATIVATADEGSGPKAASGRAKDGAATIADAPAAPPDRGARGKKGGGRSGRKDREPEPSGSRTGLVLALVGAGVLGSVAALLAGGAVLWLRWAGTTPPSTPPYPLQAFHPDGGGEVPPPPPPVLPTQTNPLTRVPPPPPPPPPPPAAGEVRRLASVQAPILSLVFSPDGRLAAGVDGNCAYVWDVAAGRLLHRLGEDGRAGQALAFAPDGKVVYLGGPGRVLQRWDAEGGRLLRDYAGPTSTIHAIAVSPDGGRVFAAAGDLEVQGDKPVLKDGRLAYRDCAVRAWDVATGRELHPFEGHTDPVAQLTLSADGRRALSRSPSRLCLWDADTGREVRGLGDAIGLGGQLTAAVLCPDGRHALLGTAAGGLLLWDVDADREVRRFEGTVGRITAVAVSADGSRALSGSHVLSPDTQPKVRDCRVCLWDVATGRELHHFDGHAEAIGSVAFTADGRLAGSSSWDRTVRLWDLSVADPVAVRPAPGAGDKPKPGTGDKPKPETRPPVPVVKKAAVPGEKEQAAAQALIRKEFKNDYVKKPAERAPLAQALLQKAHDTNDDPAGRYVLLREARDVAEQAGDAPTALRAIDQLDHLYAVPALDMKVKALMTAARLATAPAASRALAESGLAVLDELVAADAYEKARPLVPLVKAAAHRAPAAFAKQVDARLDEVKEAEKEHEAAEAARSTLRDKPDDADACLVAGKYLCFRKGDWDEGLPLLAKGADPGLKELARADLAGPTETADRRQVGDGWWDFAEEKPALGKTQLERRAAYWYRQALPGLLGLTRDKVAERVKQVQEQTPEWKHADTGGEVRLFEGHTAKVTCVAFLPDGRRIVSGSYDETGRLWDAQTGKELHLFKGAQGKITSVAVSSDGAQIMAGGLNPQAEIWNVDGTSGPSLGQAPGSSVASVAFAPDADRALVGDTNGIVVLWGKKGGAQNLPVGKWGSVWGIAASGDGRHVLFGCADGIAHRYDLDRRLEEGQLVGHSGPVLAVALSRDGRHAVTGGADKTARFWDVNAGKVLVRFRGNAGRVLSVALSADDRFAVTGGDDHTVRVYDTKTGAEVRRFTGHTAAVTGVAFSPDGKQVVSGSEDKTVRLWELAK